MTISHQVSASDLRRAQVAPSLDGARGLQRRQSYRRRVLLLDTLTILGVVCAAQVGRFWILPTTDAAERSTWHVTALSVGLAALWLTMLGLQRTRDLSLVGQGIEGCRRVMNATVWTFGVFAVIVVLLKLPISRGYLAIALLVGLPALVVQRQLLHRELGRQRDRGEFLSRVLMVGKPESVKMLSESLVRAPGAGYQIVGVCIPDHVSTDDEFLSTPVGSIPVLGDATTIEAALELTGADTLAIGAVEHVGIKGMQKLLWRLESAGVDVMVVPGLADVAGPRLQVRPIDNIPMFHITPPIREGSSTFAKRAFDLSLAGLAVILATPVMALIAIAIKLDDGGPVIFRQQRVGRDGNLFRIVKFRTMTVDAEAKKSAEVAAAGPAGVFYKSANDSRITTVGRFLRATSLDELPQLFNVLAGSMSVVGPRPLVPGEGESVEDFVERRAQVKPGVTGLWPVSGRSDLPEEERIRLDHYYVDNWSCVLDLVITWRTARAVLQRKGAY